MGLQTRKTKTDIPTKLNHIPHKIDHNNKLRIINILTNKNINHDLTLTPNHTKLVTQTEIELLKSKGLMYSNISRIK